ncbi:MAG: hypothetical protein NTY61_00390, partial [Candidatus Parcubacteria bacterium]|nr:hypothetical protein [Candidatus Parcubacteria bacterium]
EGIMPGKPQVVDFLPEASELLKKQLERDAKRWGDTWLNRTIAGQDDRLVGAVRDHLDQLRNGDPSAEERKEIYLHMMGDAMINLIRILHPELFPDGSGS